MGAEVAEALVLVVPVETGKAIGGLEGTSDIEGVGEASDVETLRATAEPLVAIGEA
jgi:hypothetical protein